jgi:sigma-54 specific flagellar transcriptional regulator A
MFNLPEGGIRLDLVIGSIEMSLIQDALMRTNNVKAHAARMLRMNRTTLVEKMRRYGFPLNGSLVGSNNQQIVTKEGENYHWANC